MNIYLVISIFSAVILGLVFGWKVTDYFIPKTYDTQNAIELLLKSRPEEWNEIRLQNPSWKPDIRNTDLSEKNLSGVDFRELDLDGVNLSNTILDGALLDHASLKSAVMENISVNGVNTESPVINEYELSDKKNIRYKSLVQISKNLSLIDKLSGYDFELLIHDLFSTIGYEAVLTPPVQDGGYDINLIKYDEFGKHEIIVGIKKYSASNKVGISSVRALLGVMQNLSVNQAILVTSSSVTKEAQSFSKEIPNLRIIERSKLEKLITNYAYT